MQVARKLEAEVRQGRHEKRALLSALIPLAAFELEADVLDARAEQLLPGMHNAPDLYMYILQALLPAMLYEDRLVAFMRSSVFFFAPSRRMQKRAEWDSVHGKTLVVLLRACLPSLLSLYPSTGTKDVCFELRVALFSRWHALLGGRHAQRVEFFAKHRSLIQVFFCVRVANPTSTHFGDNGAVLHCFREQNGISRFNPSKNRCASSSTSCTTSKT